MATLGRAIAIAAEGHEGQKDKAGAPYILHPLRVMLAQRDADARIVAVLHDVLEDVKGWPPERLRAEGFSEAVVSGVVAVTKRPDEEGDENYEAFVRRAAAHPLGRVVKRADLLDNLDESRLVHPLSEKDQKRLARYRRALSLLEG